MAEDEYAATYAALAALYDEWGQGKPAHLTLVAAGSMQGVYRTLAEARSGVQALPQNRGHALLVALWPLDGWRHPRLAVDSYRRLLDQRSARRRGVRLCHGQYDQPPQRAPCASRAASTNSR